MPDDDDLPEGDLGPQPSPSEQPDAATAPTDPDFMPAPRQEANAATPDQQEKVHAGPLGSVPEPGEGERWWDPLYRFLELPAKRRLLRHLPRSVRLLDSWLINRLLALWQLDELRSAGRKRPYEDFVVPPTEKITLPVTAVAEFYTPAYARRLEQRLRRKGWTGGRLDMLYGNDSLSFLKTTRQGAGFGGWTSLASLTARGGGSWGYPGFSRQQQLPEEVNSINLFLLSLGRSITVVVANITWTIEVADALDRAMRLDHKPRIVGRGSRLTIQPRNVAAIATIQAERSRLQGIARAWLAKELPGVFAATGGGRLPTLDVVLTESYDPLSRERLSYEDQQYVRALGLHDAAIIETLPEVQNFRLSAYRPDRQRNVPRGHWMLTARYGDVYNERFTRLNNSKSPGQVGYQVQRSTMGLFARLAVSDLLGLIAARTGAERDLAAATYGRRPIRSAKRLRRQVLGASFDLAHLAEDIEFLASDRHLYEYEVAVLREQPGAYAREADEKINDEVLQRLAEGQREAVASLRTADSVSREILQTATALSANIESVRTQRIALAVGFFSFAAAVLALSHQASSWVIGILKPLIELLVAMGGSLLHI